MKYHIGVLFKHPDGGAEDGMSFTVEAENTVKALAIVTKRMLVRSGPAGYIQKYPLQEHHHYLSVWVVPALTDEQNAKAVQKLMEPTYRKIRKMEADRN